jgi:two-component system invasion response regulator UvrY
MIRVVLIDDHGLVRTGLRMILQQHADMDIVGEADDGESGLALIRRVEPDIALVDVHMPGFSGVELTERVRRAKVATRIVILTIANEAPFPRRLLKAGASAYLTKGCPSEELIKAIRRVADGQRYIGADIAQQLALQNEHADDSPFTQLSARELECAMMLAQGLGAQVIATNIAFSKNLESATSSRSRIWSRRTELRTAVQPPRRALLTDRRGLCRQSITSMYRRRKCEALLVVARMELPPAAARWNRASMVSAFSLRWRQVDAYESSAADAVPLATTELAASTMR